MCLGGGGGEQIVSFDIGTGVLTWLLLHVILHHPCGAFFHAGKPMGKRNRGGWAELYGSGHVMIGDI